MTKDEINRTWRNLFVPFGIGIAVFIIAFIFWAMSGNSSTQMISIFGLVFGLIFMIMPLGKMRKFRKYLKTLKDKKK